MNSNQTVNDFKISAVIHNEETQPGPSNHKDIKNTQGIEASVITENKTLLHRSVSKNNLNEIRKYTSSSFSSSSSSHDDDDNNELETSLKNKRWLATNSTTNSQAQFDHSLNGVLIPNHEPTNFGDTYVDSSDNVHVGSRIYYKGPITVNQYLYNKSVSENKDNIVEKNICENIGDLEESNCNDEQNSNQKTKLSDGFSCLICNYLKPARGKCKICVISICTIILISLITYGILYIVMKENDTTIPIPVTTTIATTIVTTRQSSTTQITSTTQLSTTTQKTTTDHSTVPGEIVPPSHPEKFFQLEQIGEQTVFIKWDKPKFDGGAPLLIYIVEMKDVDAMEWEEAITVKADIQNVTLKNLKVRHLYYFQIFAKNRIGCSKPLKSNFGVYIADLPTPPNGFKNIEQIAEDKVSLIWNKPRYSNGAPILSYRIEFKDDSYNAWILAGVTKENMFIVEKLQIHHAYYFRIFAKNSAGYSKPLESEKINIL